MTIHPYAVLGLAILGEVTGTVAIKASEGLTKMPATAIVIVSYIVAFYCLSIVVKTIPLGVAYAIWSGVGMAVVVVAAMLIYGQKPDIAAFVGIALIGAGVLVIHLFSNAAAH